MNDYLNNPLLLIIDMQNVYKEGQPWECKNYDNALSNVLALLDDGHFSQDNTILTRYIASAHQQEYGRTTTKSTQRSTQTSGITI